MRKVSIFLLLLMPCLLFSRELFYPVYEIPKHLLENADAVVRLQDTRISVRSESGAKLKRHEVVTILNADGINYGTFYGFYDKDLKISELKYSIYDASGCLIEKVKEKSFQDMSAVSGFSLYDDNRVLYYKPYVNTFPYTIEISYTYSFSGIAYFPPWMPQSGNNVSVEKASLVLLQDNEIGIHTKSFNIDPPADVTEEAGSKLCEWEILEVPAFKEEPFSPGFRAELPMVYVFPDHISLGGYKGKLETWQDMGRWIGLLNEGQGHLSPDCRLAVKEIKAASTDPVDLAKRIYAHVQENTRYVSIQYGIGGFRPFDAETVHEMGYGDCKALSNYTLALLKEAGIAANYTLINAGDDAQPIILDMPGFQFNHVILHIPLEKDTIWLECTSQDNPFGYLGSFTDNRYGLAITEDGGRLVKTPEYTQDQNVLSGSSTILLADDGSAEIHYVLNFNGFMYDNIYNFILEDNSEQKKWIYENLWLSNFKLINFSFTNNKNRIPDADLILKIETPKYASVSGKRIFIKNNILLNHQDKLPELGVRKTDIFLRRSYVHTDTIIYHFNPEWTLENMPDDFQDQQLFGSHSFKAEATAGKLTIIRKISLNRGTYDKALYPDFRAFFKGICNYEGAKFVFIKSSS